MGFRCMYVWLFKHRDNPVCSAGRCFSNPFSIMILKVQFSEGISVSFLGGPSNALLCFGIESVEPRLVVFLETSTFSSYDFI